jgi:signal transduction histidine kinase
MSLKIGFTQIFRSKVRSSRQFWGLLILLLAGIVGNYLRWTLFFDIDFLFGSIAVWIVVCLYGIRWGTFAGFLSGLCTYFLWKHPYTAITFTLEAIFVGWLFHRQQQPQAHQSHSQNNIVLLDFLFWLVIGMPLVWFFYANLLRVEHTQALIILMKQPVNGIFKALIASLLLTHVPIYRWVKRPPAINSLALGQTLFNLLFAFVAVPTLILIILGSHQVVDDIKRTVGLDLNNSARYLSVEVRGWYDRRFDAISQLAALVKVNEIKSATFQQNARFISQVFPDVERIHVLDGDGQTVLEIESGNIENRNSAKYSFNETDYFSKIKQSPKAFLSPVLTDDPSISPMILMGVPILNDGKLVGAIFAEINLKGITDLLVSNVEEALLNITIVDQQQTIAASTNIESIGYQKFDWRKNGTVTEMGNQNYHWLPMGGSRLVMVKWQNSLFVKELEIRDDIPWTLIIQIAATPHVQQIEKVHTRNMAILLFISGLALISANLVSRQVVRPLKQLAEVTTNLPDKLLLEREPIAWIHSHVTELSLLIRNFRMMAMSLQQKFREIRQVNEFLEERVQERTQALQQTNTELAAEIAERQRVEADRDSLIESLQVSEAQIRQLNIELEERVMRRTAQLEMANRELESFSYSVSHDLRAPLRAIDGFTQMLQEDYSHNFDAEANRYLKVVRDNAKRMGVLIDDLLNLARLNRKELSRQTTFPTVLINQLINDLRPTWIGRQIEFAIADLPPHQADLSLITQVWINLLSNAIKYTGKVDQARIEVGYIAHDAEIVYFIRDNGAGFDMQYATKLFGVFQRMHLDNEFEGNGIGLAIAQRIIHRHDGKIWAEAAINQGATFYFTIPKAKSA